MTKRTTLPFGLGFQVVGDDALVKSFASYGTAVRARVRRALEDIARETSMRERSQMRARTGKTRAGFTYEITDTPAGIKAYIGPDRGRFGWKGIFQESGVSGTVVVRRFKRGSRGGYARKTITLKSGAKRKIKDVAGTYTRRVNIPKHPFVRPTWESIRGRVKGAIEAAIEQGKKEAGLA